jgi:hypothetical protein
MRGRRVRFIPVFSTEEMQAIREQYEVRILDEEQRRERLEWNLKVALARLKDVEEALKGINKEDPRRDARLRPFVYPKRARA